MDVEVLDQNRQILTKAALDIKGGQGMLKPAKPLIEGHYYIKAEDTVRSSTTVDAHGSVRTQGSGSKRRAIWPFWHRRSDSKRGTCSSRSWPKSGSSPEF